MKNGEKIWHYKRINNDNEETPTYEKPIEYVLRSPTAFSPIGITCQPKTGYTDMLAYGETTNTDNRIVLQPYTYWKDMFREGDLFCADGAKPTENEDLFGQDANFYVEFVSKQNEAIVLSLKRIKGR